jgi:hypothetical protein
MCQFSSHLNLSLIFSPFFPVLAARRFGVQSWKAWLLSLSVDLTSRGLMGLAFANRREGPMTALEADEYGRRAYLLLYYLLRGPFYQHFTKYVVFVAKIRPSEFIITDAPYSCSDQNLKLSAMPQKLALWLLLSLVL